MAQTTSLKMTPWRKVHAKFGLSASALARALDRHRSKISRALRDDDGLINGPDQRRILEAAKTLNVEISSTDLTPEL